MGDLPLANCENAASAYRSTAAKPGSAACSLAWPTISRVSDKASGPGTSGVVALVPARGGSKRIPRKNIKPFRGTPLVARVIETLVGSGLFERVVVSTDDDEIAAVAEEAGAQVPFRRPPELSDDHAGTRPVIQHAIDELLAAGVSVEEVCVSYPAAVFVAARDVARGLELLRSSDAQFVMTAASFPAPVKRALTVGEDGLARMLWPEFAMSRSQDLGEVYHDAGQFYWGTREAWQTGPSVLTARTVLHVLPHWQVQDIDTPEDWERAELIHELAEGLAR